MAKKKIQPPLQQSPARATKNEILIWTMCRQILTTYAKVLTNVHTVQEARRLREAILAEIEAIHPEVVDGMELWHQATRGMIDEIKDESIKGPTAYALDRLGLWPRDKKVTS
jgi:thymidylate synthase ThyX